jgi:hypothetical protein
MLVYETLLVIGALGLVVMTLLGFAHPGHGGGHALGARHGGPLQAAGARGGGAAAHGHAGHGPAHAGHHGHAPGMRAWGSNLVFELLSPLTVFSLALGAGATGLILHSLGILGVPAAVVAALGALFLYAVILRPLRLLIFSFASRPAQALEGALMQEAEVITSFNARGEGIVRLNVDGQCVDVLARLDPSEHGARISRGHRVLVEEVDSHRNEVRVSRL